MENVVNTKDSFIHRGHSRNAYSWWLFGIWIVLPILAPLLLSKIGIDIGGIFTVERSYSSGVTASGFKIDLISVWPIQIPLYILATYKRVLDTSLNRWFTILFSVPVINLIMLIWPTKKI